MCLNDLIIRYTGTALERVDVLRKACVQEIVRRKELDEGMGGCGSEFAWVELVGEGVDCTGFRMLGSESTGRGRTGNRISPEEIYLEYRFWVREL